MTRFFPGVTPFNYTKICPLATGVHLCTATLQWSHTHTRVSALHSILLSASETRTHTHSPTHTHTSGSPPFSQWEAKAWGHLRLPLTAAPHLCCQAGVTHVAEISYCAKLTWAAVSVCHRRLSFCDEQETKTKGHIIASFTVRRNDVWPASRWVWSTSGQWWNVTKYLYFVTVLKYIFMYLYFT